MMNSPYSPELLKVEVESRGDATIARLIGSANMVVSTDLEDRLLELVAERPRQLILDLSELEFISSIGLGGIIAAHLRCRHHNGMIKLVNPNPDIRELLQTTRLTSLFPIHETIEAAMSAGSPN